MRLETATRLHRRGMLKTSHMTPLGAISKVFGISPEDIKGQCRQREIVRARHLAAWMLWHSGDSQIAVGKMLGGRDHSTVAHAVQMADVLMKTDKGYRAMVKRVFLLTGFKVRL